MIVFPKKDAVSNIPREIFSTQEIEDTKTIGAWQEAVSIFFNTAEHTVDPKTGEDRHVARIDACMESFMFPESLLIRTQAESQLYYRGLSDVLSDGNDGFIVQFFAAGDCFYSGDAKPTNNQTGGVCFLDMSRETIGKTSDIDTYNLILPRELIESSVPNVNDLHLTTYSPQNNLVEMLGRHLRDVHRLGAQITSNESLHVSQATTALVKAMLSATEENVYNASIIIERSLLTKIKSHIDKNLTNPALSPETISLNLGMSRAKLYRLCEPLNGIANFIKKRRLRHAFRLLAFGEEKSSSISSVAYSLGFSSPAHFTSAFRESFGMTPSDVKNQRANAIQRFTKPLAPVNDSQLASDDTVLKNWVDNILQ